MNFLTAAVPQWVSILFLLTIAIPIFMIAKLAKQATINAKLDTQIVKRVYFSILIFYGLYFTYTSITSFTGIFSENTLPPKILIYTAIPLMIFLFLFVSNLKIYKTVLENVSLEALVQVHLFRLIGVFFLIVASYGAIPTKFAYIAGIGDIATAISSIFVAKAIINKKPYAKKLAITWNIFGLLDIFSVITTAITTTIVSIETGSQNVLAIAEFPFCLIPAFAPATIIFLHISLFRKLWIERK